MHSNQFPTISRVELEDDSNGLWPEFKGGAASTWLKIDKKLFHLALLKTIFARGFDCLTCGFGVSRTSRQAGGHGNGERVKSRGPIG
jgi:hypothetical protein